MPTNPSGNEKASWDNVDADKTRGPHSARVNLGPVQFEDQYSRLPVKRAM